MGGICIALALLLAGGGLAAAADMNPPLPTARVAIGNGTSLTVELARTMEEKMRGLSHRPRLHEGRGMAFVYETPQTVGIWMKDMRFPLDILWVREGRIVKIEKEAPPLKPPQPERVYSAWADLVIEVPAGFTDRAGIRVGDPVTLKVKR